MLSNAYFLAKIRFDTAENEPAENLQNFVNFPNFANPEEDPRRPRTSHRTRPTMYGLPDIGVYYHARTISMDTAFWPTRSRIFKRLCSGLKHDKRLE